MKKEKLNLNELSVNSFVTEIDKNHRETVAGGVVTTIIIISVSVVLTVADNAGSSRQQIHTKDNNSACPINTMGTSCGGGASCNNNNC
jgi:hypothetical protein